MNTITIAGTACAIYADEAPDFILVQPCDPRDRQGLENEITVIKETGKRFCLAASAVEDWNEELSPWPAAPVFGNAVFGDGATRTLGFIEQELLPTLRKEYGSAAKVILGGYSLAGLFSLWCAYQTDCFDGVAAASPSVWFDGWIDFASARPIQTKAVYLSLGDKEHQAKNERMKTVRDCITRQDVLLQHSGIVHTLEWNPGGHFKEPDIRTAKGFAWIMTQKKSIFEGRSVP